MRPKKLFFSVLAAIPLIALLSAGAPENGHGSVLNSNGIMSAAGSPGEPGTCSEVNCHGAGNGSATTGGLPDNGGPGSISMSFTPALVNGNQYVPGQVYNVDVTVAEANRFLFGFCATILDNSGSTNLHVNNVAGTITVTDPSRTRVGQAFGTGRLFITHTSNAGLTPQFSTFSFNWTAPASGIANMYFAGIAADGNGLEDAGDNVYKGSLQVSPAANAVGQSNSETFLHAFPNPATDQLSLHFNLPVSQKVCVTLYSLDGREVTSLVNKELPAGTFLQSFDTTDLARGIYVLEVHSAHIHQSKKMIIQ